jgi:hypothetical protein
VSTARQCAEWHQKGVTEERFYVLVFPEWQERISGLSTKSSCTSSLERFEPERLKTCGNVRSNSARVG